MLIRIFSLAFLFHAPCYTTLWLCPPIQILEGKQHLWSIYCAPIINASPQVPPYFQALSVCKQFSLMILLHLACSGRNAHLLHLFKSYWYSCDKSNECQRLRLGWRVRDPSFITYLLSNYQVPNTILGVTGKDPILMECVCTGETEVTNTEHINAASLQTEKRFADYVTQVWHASGWHELF